MSAFLLIRRMLKTRKLLNLFVMALLIFGISIEQSIADRTTERTDDVLIEQASATRAKVGETAFLRFQVSNYTSDTIRLIGVRSPVTRQANLIIVMPDVGAQVVNSLSILEEETLNVASSHIRVELKNVTSRIEAGSDVEFELIFENFITTATAHVHKH